MTAPSKYIVGTSGYSFEDWVGTFYPAGTRTRDMFGQYAQHFTAVELNFTFYRMPEPRTLARMAEAAPPGFEFWVKVNQEITHQHKRELIAPFAESLSPLRQDGKLAGLLLQFPQSFQRTPASRTFLAGALKDFTDRDLRAAVEFRHRSWEHPSVLEGLRERKVSLVVPDEPDIPNLYHPRPVIAGNIGYLRLHSRDSKGWYAGMAQRYDYNYSEAQLRDVLTQWQPLEDQAEKTYVFFNNCHRGQAAQNAEAFRRIVGQIQ